MPARKLFVPSEGNSLETTQPVALISRQRKRESLKEKSARASAISARLAQAYPDLEVPLEYETTFQLLVAVVLSAQCTDSAVNKVTPELFHRFPTPIQLANTSLEEIESIIRTLGLFRAKARSLKACARQLIEQFNGEVPGTMEELTTLAGVGRKTANVLLGHAFDSPGIIVDTHCKRLSRRLGLTRSANPVKIELDLNKILPPDQWTGFSHRLIIHGRRICHARKPNCNACVVNQFCPSRNLTS
ncbi:MAG: endonuclease III [Deltaproteobacteria bacterium]|nr:endonuclease III [Deltaproteobacteria bacterium]